MPQMESAPLVPVVYVVDDDISVRESLEPLIAFEGWKAVMCASAKEFLEQQRTAVPSCLILDISLPDLNGLDLQEQISGDRTEIPIIFITGYGDVPMTVKAMKAGALEFLMKPFPDDVLINAIRYALDRSATSLEDKSALQSIRDGHSSLSRREREVMALVVAGLLNKQVGFELGISEITVKAHRGQVMRKMKARSLPDLVNMSARLRLPETQSSKVEHPSSLTDPMVSGTPSSNRSAPKTVT